MKPDPRSCAGAANARSPFERTVLTRGKATLITYMGAGDSHPTLVLCQVERLRESDLEPLEKLQSFCTARHVLFAVVAPDEAARAMAETLQRWGIMVFLKAPTDEEVESFVRVQRLMRHPAVWV